MKSHHVVPDKNGGWNVKKSGASRASIHTNTKAEAVKMARTISNNQHSELFIHGKNGRIQGRDSHGHDTFPPRG